MKLLLVISCYLVLIVCSSFIEEKDDNSRNLKCSDLADDVACFESVLKQYSLTVGEEKVVFKIKPFDYQVDLAKPDFSVALNPFFYTVNGHQLNFFLKVYLEMFSQLFPGLENVSIHQHDVTGLIVFGLLHLMAEEGGIFGFSLIRELISQLHENFDPFSMILIVLENSLEFGTLLGKSDALALLFEFAIENNCYYTAEAFFVTELRKINKGLFLASIEACGRCGDLRFRTRIASSLKASDLFEVTNEMSGHSFWPHFGQIKIGPLVTILGRLTGREIEYSCLFAVPNSLDLDELCSYQVSEFLEEVKLFCSFFQS
jgi:hypothetical protein